MTTVITSELDRYNEMVAELTSLDFLEEHYVIGNGNGYYKKFFIKNSPYHFELSYSTYSGKINKAYLCSEPIRWSMEFELFFERQPENIQEKIIFHLDLFR